MIEDYPLSTMAGKCPLETIMKGPHYNYRRADAFTTPTYLKLISIPPFLKPGDLIRMGMLFVLQLIDHLFGYHIFTASSIYNDITYLSAGGTPCSSDVGSQPIIIARHARGDQGSSDHQANGYLTKQTSHYLFLWILKPVPLEV